MPQEAGPLVTLHICSGAPVRLAVPSRKGNRLRDAHHPGESQFNCTEGRSGTQVAACVRSAVVEAPWCRPTYVPLADPRSLDAHIEGQLKSQPPCPARAGPHPRVTLSVAGRTIEWDTSDSALRGRILALVH